MQSQASSMSLVERARSRDQATTLAISKMTELLQEAKTKGLGTLKDKEEGEFDQTKYPNYRWKYWKTLVPAPDFAGMISAIAGKDGKENESQDAGLFAGPLKAITKIWGEALREIHIEVTWGEGRTQRSYELVTHLIAQDAMSQLQGIVSALGGGSAQGAAPQDQQNPQGQKPPQQSSPQGLQPGNPENE